MSHCIGYACRTHPLAFTDLWLWQWLMEGWPAINALRDWAPECCSFTGPGWERCCQKPRCGPIDPATFPSVGDSCSAKELRDATLPCYVRRTASNSVSVAAGGKVTNDHFWMSHLCKHPLHVTAVKPVLKTKRELPFVFLSENFSLKPLIFLKLHSVAWNWTTVKVTTAYDIVLSTWTRSLEPFVC